MEYNIGKKLFTREHSKLVLTNSGQVMYEQAKKILAKVEETKRRVSDADDDIGGSVAIGILPTLAPFLLSRALLSLSEKYPNASVMVREEVSEVIVEAVKRGEIDILIETLPFDDADLNIEPLLSDEFYFAVHRDNPLARLEEISINKLGDMPFILMKDIHCMVRQIEKYLFAKSFVPKVMFQAAEIATVKQLIELQYGISILPWISIDKDSDTVIRYIRLCGEKPFREVVLAIAKDRYLSPAAECFIDIVRNQFQATRTRNSADSIECH